MFYMILFNKSVYAFYSSIALKKNHSYKFLDLPVMIYTVDMFLTPRYRSWVQWQCTLETYSKLQLFQVQLLNKLQMFSKLTQRSLLRT